MQVITERAKYLQVLEQIAPLAQEAQGDAMVTRVNALTDSVRTGELLVRDWAATFYEFQAPPK